METQWEFRFGRLAYSAALMLAAWYLYDFWACVLVLAATVDVEVEP